MINTTRFSGAVAPLGQLTPLLTGPRTPVPEISENDSHAIVGELRDIIGHEAFEKYSDFQTFLDKRDRHPRDGLVLSYDDYCALGNLGCICQFDNGITPEMLMAPHRRQRVADLFQKLKTTDSKRVFIGAFHGNLECVRYVLTSCSGIREIDPWYLTTPLRNRR